MAYTKFNSDLVNIIRSLPDAPTLSATELKIAFDKGSMNLAEYLNSTLTDEIESKDYSFEVAIERIDSLVQAINNTVNLLNSSVNSLLTSYNLHKSSASHISSSERALWNSKQKKITYGVSAPTGGTDGDIYIQI